MRKPSLNILRRALADAERNWNEANRVFWDRWIDQMRQQVAEREAKQGAKAP